MKIFVEFLPINCSYCDVCHTRPYDNKYKIDGEKFCGILNEDVEVYYYHGDGRPEFCPLREIPKKIQLKGIITNYGCSTDYEDGWNACIDEMIFE